MPAGTWGPGAARRHNGTWLAAAAALLFLAAPLSVSGIDIATGLLYLAVLYHRWRVPAAGRLPSWLPAAFAGLPLAAAVSAAVNPAPLRNLVQLAELWQLGLPLALLPALGVAGSRRLLAVLWGPAVLMAAYAVVQHYWGVDWLRPAGEKLVTPATEAGSDVFHGKGAFSHHLTFAGVMLMLAPLFASLARHAPGRDRWLWALGAVAALAGVLASLGRSGWLGAGVGLLLVGLGFPRRLALPLVAVAAVLALAAGALASGWLGEAIPPGDRPGVVKRLLHTSLEGERGRLYTWQAAWRVIRAHPVAGVGLGNDEHHLPAARRAVLAQHPGFRFPGGLTTHAHNVYLQVWLELGLTGLAAYLYLWGAVLAWGAYWMRRAGEALRWERGVLSGAAAGLVGSMAAGCFENNFFDSEVQNLVLVFMGLVLHAGLALRGRLRGPGAAAR